MKWEAKGVDRNTGKDATIIVEATDEAQANRRANRSGLLVEAVRPLDPDDSAAGLPVIQTAIATRRPAEIQPVPPTPTVVFVSQPQAAPPQQKYGPGVVTIQKTGKVWKLQLAFSTMLFVGGGVITVLALANQIPVGLLAIGLPALGLGLIWHIFSRIGAWWFHG